MLTLLWGPEVALRVMFRFLIMTNEYSGAIRIYPLPRYSVCCVVLRQKRGPGLSRPQTLRQT